MKKITTFIELIKNNPREIGRAIDANLMKWKLMKHVPDQVFLKIRYALCIHKRLNLSKPISFNEKLQWLKLYYRDSLYETLVDKCEVKKYVKKFPGLNVIPSIAVWEHVEDIDPSVLPDKFVLKCTHDTGSTIICKNRDMFDFDSAKEKLQEAMERNMFYQGREWVYRNIKPRIIAEPFFTDGNTEELKDYKLMCFNGRVRCSFVCSDRFSADGLHVTFFDHNWNIMPFTRHYPRRNDGILMPHNYRKMVELAEQMSKDMPFVRIDFYEINNEIYFGEYTFFPGSGLEEFTPDEWDKTLGEWIVLPEKRMKIMR